MNFWVKVKYEFGFWLTAGAKKQTILNKFDDTTKKHQIKQFYKNSRLILQK